MVCITQPLKPAYAHPYFFFFFQAEDGIRDLTVTGVQTCALPIFFHWHLSENQGFRAESRKFPKLHELGSDSLYYTQDEIRDLIAYARDRGIRVVDRKSVV